MWKVVGFKFRDAENGSRYYDVYLQRELSSGQGLECKAINYSARYVDYVPSMNDIVVVSTREYNGRTIVSEMYKVK